MKEQLAGQAPTISKKVSPLIEFWGDNNRKMKNEKKRFFIVFKNGKQQVLVLLKNEFKRVFFHSKI